MTDLQQIGNYNSQRSYPGRITTLKNTALTRILQLSSWGVGISFFAWAYFDPRFKDVEGFLEGEFCLPVAAGVALIVLGSAARGRLKISAFWFSLALVGQAMALQMIEAGPLIHYQHYKPFDRLVTENHPLLLIYLSVQAALVVLGFRNRWPTIRSSLIRNFKVWQLLGVGLLFFLCSATVSREVSVYVVELFFAAFVQAVNLANIVLVVWALPDETVVSWKQRLQKWFGPSGKEDVAESGGVDRFALLATIWVIILAVLLSLFSYERHPHVPDEVIYLYHARYLANGMLTVPAPPVPEAFSFYMIPQESSMWYSIFPPGWPVMLGLGVLLRAPWLVNPLLAGLNVLFTYVFVREIYSRRTARIAILLLCVSPWHAFMAMNFMSHTFTLTCSLGAAVAISRARRSDKIIWGWLGGLAIGTVSLIRPLEGVILAGLLGLWAIGVGGRRLRASSIAAFVLGAIVVGALILPYNKQITGHPTVFPLTAYYNKYFGPKTFALGFGPDRGLTLAIDPLPGHSPLEALINANLNTFSVNIELFGWSTGSLIIVGLLLFSGRMRRREYLMIAVIAANFGLYSLFWYSGGPDFGARYWYLMLVPCVVLTVRGIRFLERIFGDSSVGCANSTRVMVGVLSLCMLTLVNYIPWRAIDKYHHYRGMRPDIRYLAKEHDFGKSLVLIRGDFPSDYASAWAYNPLDPYADAPVYAWDRNPEVRARVLQAYPHRPVWIINSPSITRGAFKVIKGPLPTLEMGNEMARKNRPWTAGVASKEK